jgi:hypothetical protein
MDQEENGRIAGEWYELAGEVRNVVTDQGVCAWRYQSLIRAGFTASQAEIVATDADIDVHWLIDLTRRGCPHGTACRIAGLELPERERDPSKALASVP